MHRARGGQQQRKRAGRRAAVCVVGVAGSWRGAQRRQAASAVTSPHCLPPPSTVPATPSPHVGGGAPPLRTPLRESSQIRLSMMLSRVFKFAKSALMSARMALNSLYRKLVPPTVKLTMPARKTPATFNQCSSTYCASAAPKLRPEPAGTGAGAGCGCCGAGGVCGSLGPSPPGLQGRATCNSCARWRPAEATGKATLERREARCLLGAFESGAGMRWGPSRPIRTCQRRVARGWPQVTGPQVVGPGGKALKACPGVAHGLHCSCWLLR